ncbi:MAG: hypothetical protein GY834_05530 [Bacteroidetes bacterium]|nr:hypothetical protein [Bacteroidota bacterium]
MDFKRKIQIKVGKYLLERKVKSVKSQKKFHNLETATSIGIVYEYKSKEEFVIIEDLIRKLNEERKIVKALVYINNPNLLECIPQKLTVNYICPKELNWYLRPDSEYVTDFIKREFDILIDLNTNNLIPLAFVSGLSRAMYKVGMFSKRNKQLDMMIKMPETVDLENLLKEIMRYLKEVKAK